MKRFAIAAFVFGVLGGAACTPDDAQYPIMAASPNVPPRLEMQAGSGGGGGGGGGGNTAPDAGTGFGLHDGGLVDGLTLFDGQRGDAGARLDGSPPDATALLPDSAQSQVPPFP